jgi:hypothetical protein
MDFNMGLPKTTKKHNESTKKHNAIMRVVDKLSKESHFIPVKSTYKAIYVANIFMKEILDCMACPRQSF